LVEGIACGIPVYFRNGPLAYTSAAKSHVTVGIARGIEVNDPSWHVQATGNSPIRKAIVNLKDGLDEAVLREWLPQATALDESGHDE
jgi:hypothetical protein